MRGKGRFSAPETTQQQSRASAPAPHDDILWALRHVSFEVRQGEVVGLIGRNGAGKSTLLKLLARITRPTEGWAEVRGRVGSLLEVGTGFHPQLTGRENVFLSGAILGMRKAEIARKFDEIVAFAEVDRFLDTQLKHYSSGMQMRLAFAVAAHLEPEILFVDEVLAVGDAAFQKKCLGKMSDVARQGRTILFVSHNMAAINALCHRCLILEGGTVTFDGPTSHATSQYYSRAIGASRDSDLSIRERKGTGKAKFLSIAVHALDSAGRKMEIGYPGCDLSVKVSVQCLAAFPEANLAVILYDSAGYRLIDTNTAQQGRYVSLEPGQTAEAEFVLKQVLLRPGKYFIELWLGRHGLETIDEVEYAASIDFSETAESTKHSTIFPGTYLCRFEHRVSVLQPSP